MASRLVPSTDVDGEGSVRLREECRHMKVDDTTVVMVLLH
jgi:hypothetical protein